MSYMEGKIQEFIKATQVELDDLCERLNPPEDWESPLWDTANRVHNWRNYASSELQSEWPGMPGRLRLIVSAALNEIASNERWD